MSYRNTTQEETRNRQKRGNVPAHRPGNAGSPHRPGLRGRAFRRILCAMVCASIICGTTASVLPDSALTALAETTDGAAEGGSGDAAAADAASNTAVTDSGSTGTEGASAQTGTSEAGTDETSESGTGAAAADDADTADASGSDTTDTADADTTTQADTSDADTEGTADTTGGDTDGTEGTDAAAGGESTGDTGTDGETTEDAETADDGEPDEEAAAAVTEAIAALPSADTFTQQYTALYNTAQNLVSEYESEYEEYTSLLSLYDAASGTGTDSSGAADSGSDSDLTALAAEVGDLAAALSSLAAEYSEAYTALTEYVDGVADDADAAKEQYNALNAASAALVTNADDLTALLAAIEEAEDAIASLPKSLDGSADTVSADDDDTSDTVSDYVVTLDIDEDAVQAVIDAMADLVGAEEFAEEAQEKLDGLDVILADFEALAQSGDPSESYIDEELAAAQDAADEDGEAGLCYYEDTLLLGDAAVLYDEALEEEALALQADYAEAYEALLTYINEVTEAAAAASDLYDALTDDERALFAGTWSSALTSENTTVLAVSSSSSASSEDDSEEESAASFAGSDLSGTAFTASDDDPYTVTDEDGVSYTLTSAQAALAEQAAEAYDNYTALEEALEEVNLTLEDYDEELTVEYIEAGDGEVTLTGGTDGISVSVTGMKSALNGATGVTASVITDETLIDAYADVLSDYDESMTFTIRDAFDIRLIDEDGEEVEPTDTVSVTLSGSIIDSYGSLGGMSFIHFAETDGPTGTLTASDITLDNLDVEILDITAENDDTDTETEVTYEVDSFSTTVTTNGTTWTLITNDYYTSNNWWGTSSSDDSTDGAQAVLGSTGNYRLATKTTSSLTSTDIYITSTITINSGVSVVLDLNGHNIYVENGPLFTVASGGSLTIMDSQADGTVSTASTTGSTDYSGSNSSTVNLGTSAATSVSLSTTSIEINQYLSDEDGYNSSNNYSVSVKKYTFDYYVTNSTISETTTGVTAESITKYSVTYTGGGIYVSSNNTASIDNLVNTTGGTFELQSGILSNTCSNGHAVVLDTNSGGTVTISGGLLTGSTGSGNGGAIYQGSGTLNLTGGYVAGNTTNYGAGLYMASGTANISGSAVIAANKAYLSGGGIYAAGGTLNISGSDSEDQLGAVIASNEAMYTYSDTSASGYGGGGVALSGATANMTGGYVTNNVVNYVMTSYGDEGNGENGGSGFRVLSGATLNLSDGCITGNYAKESGGGIHVNGTLTMTGGIVASNVADAAEGGGIRISYDSSASTISGGYITNNETLTGKNGYNSTDADWGGGGIFVATYGKLTITNVLVTDNAAGGFGGGVAGCPTGTLYLSGSDGVLLYGNTAEGDNMSSGSSKTNDATAKSSEYFTSYKNAADYYCPYGSVVTGTALGGGSEDYVGYADGSAISFGAGEVKTASDYMGLYSKLSYYSSTDDGYATAQATIAAGTAAAAVYMTGNYSYTHGGAIMSNGTLVIGASTDVTTSAGLSLTATKAYVAGTELVELEGGEFSFVVLNNITSTTTDGVATYSYEDSYVITTITNSATSEDSNGDLEAAETENYTLSFPLGTTKYPNESYPNSSCTYVLYLMEVSDSTDTSVAEWSDHIYRIEITVTYATTSSTVSSYTSGSDSETTVTTYTYTISGIKVYEGVSADDDSLLYDSSSSSSGTTTDGVTVTGTVSSSSSTVSVLKIGGDTADSAAFVNTKAVYSLPSTGGDGPVVPYTAVGLTLILAAAFVLLMTRRYLRGTAGTDDLHFWE